MRAMVSRRPRDWHIGSSSLVGTIRENKNTYATRPVGRHKNTNILFVRKAGDWLYCLRARAERAIPIEACKWFCTRKETAIFPRRCELSLPTRYSGQDSDCSSRYVGNCFG